MLLQLCWCRSGVFSQCLNEPVFGVYSNNLRVKQNCSLRAISNPSSNGLVAKTDSVHLRALKLDSAIFSWHSQPCLWCLNGNPMIIFLNRHILVSRFEGLLKINSAISMVLVLVQFEPPSLPSLAALWNSKQFSDIWFHLHLVSKILFFVIEEEFKKEADNKWVAGPDLNEPSICYELTFIGMDKIRSPLLLVLMDAFKG